jgi:hypothetical protein
MPEYHHELLEGPQFPEQRMMNGRLRIKLALTMLLLGAPGGTLFPAAEGIGSGCRRAREGSSVLLCDDFEDKSDLHRWEIGSNSDSWPSADFVLCADGFGYGDRCAAWSNRLMFDTYWGFWGYDAWRSFAPRNEFYVRWYQYMSDPYSWGPLEDKSLLLHDPLDASMTAYVATSRNEWPAIPNSGPGMPFVANYQDLDWEETAGQYTKVNRFQNQGNDLTLQPGRWYLFEWYVRLNTPGVSDGLTRLWIDDASQPIGKQTLRLEYDDMRWRRSHEGGKRFGFLRLTAYNQRCDGNPNSCPPNGPSILDQSQRWDHIVISKRRVGPIQFAPVCTRAYPVARPFWFRNRKVVAVTIGGVIDPRQQPVTITIEGADERADDERDRRWRRDDERDRRWRWDDDDVVVIRGDTVLLPAAGERRHERGYTIHFEARNLDGLECSGSVRFRAPFGEPGRPR